jgi:conjugal transfer pilus assembly protein TraE
MLAALAFLLATSQIVTSSFLFFKSERVIVVPPMVEKEFWVDGKGISPSYLEQMGQFLGQLLLGKSYHSAASQRSVLLHHTEASFTGPLRKKLIEEEEFLKKQNASYVFYPTEMKIDPVELKVLLRGDRVFFVSGNQISSEREGYILSFSYTGSRLVLTGIESENKTS